MLHANKPSQIARNARPSRGSRINERPCNASQSQLRELRNPRQSALRLPRRAVGAGQLSRRAAGAEAGRGKGVADLAEHRRVVNIRDRWDASRQHVMLIR